MKWLPTSYVRSLISEGRIRYATVEQTKEGLRPRTIEREGPTGLSTTTTRLSLHPENETRILSLTIADTQEQTRKVFLALAASANREPPDLNKWHSLQKWIEHADNDC